MNLSEYIRTHTHICIYINKYMYTFIYIYIYAYMYIYTYICIYIHIHIYKDIYNIYIHVHIYAYTHIHIYTHNTYTYIPKHHVRKFRIVDIFYTWPPFRLKSLGILTIRFFFHSKKLSSKKRKNVNWSMLSRIHWNISHLAALPPRILAKF